MPLYKNTADQKIAIIAIDTSDGSLETGDAANITAQISLDGAASAGTNDVNPTELDNVNHPGVYIFDMLQNETDANLIILTSSSITANISCGESMIIYTQERPIEEVNTELASIPTTTGTLRTMIQFLFEYFRNARTETSAAESLKKEDGSTELGSRTLSDNGITFTRGEMN